MRQTKYVITCNRVGIEYAVIFASHINHDEVVNKGNAMAGGFFQVDSEGAVECYGRSVSLEKMSRPEEDAKLIREALFPRF